MRHITAFLFLFMAIQSFCQEHADYKQNLPPGFSLHDVNNELGQECTKDLDMDGENDLIIELFDHDENAESPSIIAIYLSSRFNADNSYQWFNWIWSGNSLYLNCEEKIEISGGMESQGIYQNLELVYSQPGKKIIVKSYKDSDGESAFEINTSIIEITAGSQKSSPKLGFEVKTVKGNNLQEGTHGDNSEIELIFSVEGTQVDSFKEFGQIDIENVEDGNLTAYFASDLSQVTISTEIINDKKNLVTKLLFFDGEERIIWVRTYINSNGQWLMSKCTGECED